MKASHNGKENQKDQLKFLFYVKTNFKVIKCTKKSTSLLISWKLTYVFLIIETANLTNQIINYKLIEYLYEYRNVISLPTLKGR